MVAKVLALCARHTVIICTQIHSCNNLMNFYAYFAHEQTETHRRLSNLLDVTCPHNLTSEFAFFTFL